MMTSGEVLLVAMPFFVMALGYVAFRIVRREQKQWHAAQRRVEGPAE